MRTLRWVLYLLTHSFRLHCLLIRRMYMLHYRSPLQMTQSSNLCSSLLREYLKEKAMLCKCSVSFGHTMGLHSINTSSHWTLMVCSQQLNTWMTEQIQFHYFDYVQQLMIDSCTQKCNKTRGFSWSCLLTPVIIDGSGALKPYTRKFFMYYYTA